MAQDARVRYTKTVIKDNFVNLLKTKPLNKITVKELCEAAEINRATFYKYYADAYDLMDKIEDEILAEFQKTMNDSLKNGIRQTLVDILEKMKENSALYIPLFSENGDSGFALKIFRMCYNEFEEYINKAFPSLDTAQRAWIYIYTAQGASGILHYWIADQMAEPAEEVAEFIDKLITSTLRLK